MMIPFIVLMPVKNSASASLGLTLAELGVPLQRCRPVKQKMQIAAASAAADLNWS